MLLSGRQAFKGLQVGTVCVNLGRMTNNQAEYYGLLAGLEAAKFVGVKRLKVLGDSQLVVRQVGAVLCEKHFSYITGSGVTTGIVKAAVAAPCHVLSICLLRAAA